MNIIYYHDNCFDGMMAATLYYEHVKKSGGPDTIKVLPVRYHRPLTIEQMKEDGGGELPASIFVDFCPPAQLLKDLFRERAPFTGKRAPFTVYDHHLHAWQTLQGLEAWQPFVYWPLYYSETHSGASLVWDMFCTCNILASWADAVPAPPIVQAIADGDTHAPGEYTYLPEQKMVERVRRRLSFVPFNVESYAPLLDMTLEEMIEWSEVSPQLREKAEAERALLLSYTHRKSITYPRGGHYETLDVPIVNATRAVAGAMANYLISDEAASKGKGAELAMAYWLDGDIVVVEIRSRNGLAREVALTYGGGGHANAAGFHMSVNNLAAFLQGLTPY